MNPSAAAVVTTLTGEVSTLSREASGMANTLSAYALDVVVALVLFGVFWVAAMLSKRLVRSLLSRWATDSDVGIIMGRATYWVVMAIGLVTCLSVAGFPVATLLAAFGLAGAALALALRDVIANIVSGLFLLAKRPFRIGDSIVVDENEGVVLDITVRNTVIEAPDGRMVFLPNSKVIGSVLVNSSAVHRRRVLLEVDVSRDGDPLRAASVIAEALAGIKGALSDPPASAPATLLGAQGVRLSGRVWVDTSVTDLVTARDEAIGAVHEALVDAGIELVALPETS